MQAFKTLEVEKLNKPFRVSINNIASDKSISHRVAIFSLLCNKTSKVKNYLKAEDTLNTLKIIEQLGAKITWDKDTLFINPKLEPKKQTEQKDEHSKIPLDCGNSGTAMRLLCGYLSSKEGNFTLTGDKYLQARPMKRVIEPLNKIGANITSKGSSKVECKAPLHIKGVKNLKAFSYESSISSAQVKTAMILAALQASGICTYKEKALSRDHSENILKAMGANIKICADKSIKISPLSLSKNLFLNPLNIKIPSDPSSGFFFALAAAIIPKSCVVLENISLNPTRIEAYKILASMGAKVEFIEKENIYEKVGDIKISYNGQLKATDISQNISWLIDELPALSIAMSFAKGTSSVKNASELRVKESDRISALLENLKLCNIQTKEFSDGYEIQGGGFKSAVVNSKGDHRLAMSFAIAGLKCSMKIEDTACILTSFPNFEKILKDLG